MKTEIKNRVYESPLLQETDISPEGLLCASSPIFEDFKRNENPWDWE
ncbi:MAG: hypothetical protein IJ005_07750 [Bacteroidales bacterium]|nr:hypothetical protein [Bacteroidales bacterium]